jgi:hypothetical protein
VIFRIDAGERAYISERSIGRTFGACSYTSSSKRVIRLAIRIVSEFMDHVCTSELSIEVINLKFSICFGKSHSRGLLISLVVVSIEFQISITSLMLYVELDIPPFIENVVFVFFPFPLLRIYRTNDYKGRLFEVEKIPVSIVPIVIILDTELVLFKRAPMSDPHFC